jgi:hypothetical protein
MRTKRLLTSIWIVVSLWGCNDGREEFMRAEQLRGSGADKDVVAAAYLEACVNPEAKWCKPARDEFVKLKKEAAALAEQQKEAQEEAGNFPSERSIALGSTGYIACSASRFSVAAQEDSIVVKYKVSPMCVYVLKVKGNQASWHNNLLEAAFNESIQEVYKRHENWPHLRVVIVSETTEEDKYGNVAGAHVSNISEIIVKADALRKVDMKGLTTRYMLEGDANYFAWLNSFTE